MDGQKRKEWQKGYLFPFQSRRCCHLPFVLPPASPPICHRSSPRPTQRDRPSSSLLHVRSPSHAALAVLHRLPHPQHALGVSSLASSLLYGSLLCSSFSCTTPLLLDLALMPSSLARRPSPCSLSSVLANATRVPIGSLRHQHPPCPLFVPLHAPFPTSCHQSSL
jgi:hypothetical protein